MITDILLNQIVSHYKADLKQIQIAIEHCKAKGVLTKHELWQLDKQGLPLSKILKAIILPAAPNGLDVILDTQKITYDDLICMIGIIAQDMKLQRQSRSIQR